MLTSLSKCVKDNTAPYKAWFITLDVEHSVNMMLLEYARYNDPAWFTLFNHQIHLLQTSSFGHS